MLDKILLFPYTLTLRLRHFLYDKGLKKVRRADVPTICVGNVTVGGTGKTPHPEMILRMLLSSDWAGGRNLAVLSRGYKRRSRGFQQVMTDSPSAFSGDEPLQIKKKFPGVTVAVDKDRVEGCDLLAHPEKLQEGKRRLRRCKDKDFPSAGIVILDDAFQYRRLKATLDIVLVDWNRPVYKDKLMPFGRLRDLPSRLRAADIIIVTKCPHELDNWAKTSFAYTLGLPDFATSTCSGTNAKGKVQHVFYTTVDYDAPLPVFDDSDPRYVYSKRLILFTGIANDGAMRRYLCDKYKIVRRYRFPDHHRYSRADFARLSAAASKWPTAVLMTTEKDARRVADAKNIPPQLRERMFSLPIRAEFLSPAEKTIFAGLLEKAL